MDTEKRWGLDNLHSTCRKTLKYIEKFQLSELPSLGRSATLRNSIHLVLGFREEKLRFFPSDFPRTIRRLKRYIHKETWETPLVRKLLFEFWVGISTAHPTAHLKRASYSYVMNITENPRATPLHEAVFEGNLYWIHCLCVGEDQERMYTDINGVDHLFNSPLMLAVKLKKHEEAMVLLDHGASAKYRPDPSCPCALEQAVAMKEKRVLALLIAAHHRNVFDLWENSKETFVKSLSEMPDFSLTMEWGCSSKIPFVSKLSPSDVYHIYKQGTLVRIDFTLIGWESLKSKRGKLSLVYRGDQGKVLIINHENNTIRELTPELSENEIEKAVKKLIATQKYSKELDIAETEISKNTDRKGKTKKKVIDQ